jgi:N-acetylneuraminic acid mutarotase
MKKAILFTSFILIGSWMSAQDVWVQKPNFGGAARGGAVGFAINGKGYIGTGSTNTNPGTLYQDFWEWDPVKNTWTQKADFGGGVRAAAVGFSIGTKGYIGTGVYASPPYSPDLKSNDFWEWDQNTDTWTQKANFPGAVRTWAIGFSIGSKGYIGTGDMNNDFWEWDQSTDTWTQKASLPVGRDAASAFTIGNKGYIVLGDDETESAHLWEWDQSTDTWTQKAPFPGPPRDCAAAFSIGSKGYVGTGCTRWPNFTQDLWEWDQTTDTWTQKTNFGGVSRASAVGFSIDGKGYIGTGADAPPNAYRDLWEFDPSTTMGVKETKNGLSYMQVFPNPTRHEFTITYTAPNTEIFEVSVKNSLGQIVFTDRDTNFSGVYKKTVQLDSNAKGIYFVEVSCGSGHQVNKIVLE